MSAGADGFFAIGRAEWRQACALGLNPAVAYLVMARGTGRDNSTTRWSAEAVLRHSGISWRRANSAITMIESAGLAHNVTERGKLPLRKLLFPAASDQLLWLPNALVTGAANEVPPVARLRQAQNLDYLEAFIELYGAHDLAGDGGLPRSLIYAPYAKREHICDRGQFRVHGFNKAETPYRYSECVGPLARFAQSEDGNAWDFLRAVERMGLLETVDYLAEGESPDAELLHPLTGDPDADSVREAASAVAWALPGGYKFQSERYAYSLPVMHHIAAPAVVGVSRLRYRPHTRLTAAWYAWHRETCEQYSRIYRAIAASDFKQAAA